MFNFIHEISGGLKLFRDKINEVIRVVNALMQIQGDGTFISVRHGHGTSGVTVSLNISQVLSRIPKQYNIFFPVSLSSDGGTDGDSADAPTWTYTVNDYFSGTELDTEVSPNQQRPNGSTEIAVSGIGMYGSDGSLILWWCDEIPNTVVGCTTS